MEINPTFNERQKETYLYLLDNETNEVLMGGAAGGGKAQSVDSMIVTPLKLKRMGDIKVGDVISHPSGANTNVIAIHPQGVRDVYRITFNDGASTLVTKDHLWYLWFSSHKSKQEKKTSVGKVWTTEMIINYLNEIKNRKRKYKPIIPLCNPIQFTKTTHFSDVLHPYLIGVLLGDGCITNNITFTSGDDFIINKIMGLGYEVHKLKSKYVYSVVNIKDLLVKIKLYGKKSSDKFIPEYLKYSTIENRIALINGLLDTDGYVDKRNHCHYYTISEQLAKDVQFILWSLGFKVVITEKIGKYKKNNKIIECAKCYCLYIQGNNKNILFSLPRKLNKINNKFNGGVSIPGRVIESIKYAGKKECKCITVDNPNGLYITDDFIVTHNSFIGCAWVIERCITLKGSRWLIGRSVLKNLKDTTLMTFFEVCGQWGLDPEKHFFYNTKDNIIKFDKSLGGALIFLKDLALYPSDPEYDSLGSLEITGAFIDEASQITEKAKNIVYSRIRYKLDEYGVIPKLLMTSNPGKNFIYREFYKPWKAGTLPYNRKFVQAFATENPYISKHYLTALNQLDRISRLRLRDGVWEYDDDDTVLMSIVDINDIFLNDHVPRGLSYITCDYARFGKDKTVIMVWDGWRMIDMKVMDQSSIPQAVGEIRKLMQKYNVTANRVVVDEMGTGSGLKDSLRCRGFVSSAQAVRVSGTKEQYINLRTQCYYRLSEKVSRKEIYIPTQDVRLKELIVEELEQIKRKDIDKDGKMRIVGKDEIRENIGRSCDYADAIMMRVFFEIKSARKWVI